MEIIKIGVIIISLVIIVGLGMYIFDGYTGKVVTSGNRQCDNTENLASGMGADLDGKDSIYVAGKVKTRTKSSGVWGSWTEVSDSCGTGNYADKLTERFCKNDATAFSRTVTCPNGCSGGSSNGGCNMQECTEDDDGDRKFLAGATTGVKVNDPDALGVPENPSSSFGVKTFYDSCIHAGRLKEYYCNNDGQVKVKEYSCNCQSNACLQN